MPWNLLRRYAVDGDGRAAHLFREYAGVFKKHQPLVWSPHLKGWVGLGEGATDHQLAEELPADAVSLGWLDFDEWHLVLRYRARADVLLAADGGDWRAVLDLAADLRRRWRQDRRRRGLDPPVPVLPPVLCQLALGCQMSG